MEELDTQKAALTASLAEYELLSKIQLTRDSIYFFLARFRDCDINDEDSRKRLVQTFVNAIFVYDDKITITFNYAGGSEPTTLREIEFTARDEGFVCCLPCSMPTFQLLEGFLYL